MAEFDLRAADLNIVESFDDLIVRLAAAHSAQVATLEEEVRDLREELEILKRCSDRSVSDSKNLQVAGRRGFRVQELSDLACADVVLWEDARTGTVVDLDMLHHSAQKSNGEAFRNGNHDGWCQSETSLPVSFKPLHCSSRSPHKASSRLPQLENIDKAPVAIEVFDKSWLRPEIDKSWLRPESPLKSSKVKVSFLEGKDDLDADNTFGQQKSFTGVVSQSFEGRDYGSFYTTEGTPPSSLLTPASIDERKSLVMFPSAATSPASIDERKSFVQFPFGATDSSVVDKWQSLVEKLLSTPQRELLQLKPVWIQPESFMIKAARNNQKVDIFQAAPHTRPRRRSFWRGSQISLFGEGRPPFLQTQWNRTGCKSNLTFSKDHNYESLFDSFVLDPQCGRRIVWALFGMILMIYDLIMMPMGVFDLGSHWALTFIQYMAQVFWTADILVSFFTGVYVDSELEMRFRVVSRHYAMSWLPVDIVVTLPLWFAIMAGSEESSQSGASAFKSTKFLKLLRFLRLARLIKFDHLLSETLEFINSPTVLLVIGMLKLIFGLALLNHINACVWFAVGDNSGGWTEGDKYAQRSWRYQYLSSMHWALTQFQGTSEILPGEGLLERLYAVGTVLVALILLSAFVSRLTNMMISLQNLQHSRTYEQRVVRGFLSNHNISSQLAVRCKKWVSWKQKMERSTEHDKEVEAILPKMLMMELLDEVRNPALVSHPFFLAMHGAFPKVTRSLCYQAFHPLTPSPGETIFHPGDHGHRMFFIVAGNLMYRIINTQPNPHHHFATRPSGFATIEKIRDVSAPGDGDRDISREFSDRSLRRSVDSCEPHDKFARLSKGGFLSEGALWVKIWVHHGELVVERDVSMLVLDSTHFAEVIATNNVAHASVVLYARRFVAAMNVFGKVHDDLIDPHFFLGEEDDDDNKKIRSSTSSIEMSNRTSAMSYKPRPSASQGALTSWGMKKLSSAPREHSGDASSQSSLDSK